jgi:CBS domain containing-hemolysin-like protein
MIPPFDVNTLNLFSGFAGLIFTLMIFSYVIGDNFLFKLALYIFTGVSAGYIASVAWWQVLRPNLITPLMSGSALDKALLVFPLAGILMILMKVSSRLSGISRFAMAFIVGAGAAVTIAGALRGTLIPQVEGTINSIPRLGNTADLAQNFNMLVNGVAVLLGTALTLIYFHFGARTQQDGSVRRMGVIEILAWLGRFFIGVTLGVVFAGVYAAALTALIERISSMINFFGNIP